MFAAPSRHCHPLGIAHNDAMLRMPPARNASLLTVIERGLSPACQRPSISPRLRPSFLPIRGHDFSPLVAIFSPHHMGAAAGLGQGLHPLAGGRLGESVAVLAFGDHQGNATLNYRSVLAREVTVEDAELYRRPGHRRRLRRVSRDGEGPESV